MWSLLKSAAICMRTEIVWARHRGFNNESPEVMPSQMATDNFWGFALTEMKETKMAKSKPTLTHNHEENIALFCAKNNLSFNIATAYDITLMTFKDQPIKQDLLNERGEVFSYDVTATIARQIESHPIIVERIASKIDLISELKKQEEYKINIKKAKAAENPDLNKLVDNLYRLNIVDQESYLAFVCFLMQLKYTRDNEFLENDKTCVFFNGVARNGKSATAKAICEIESQYGKVFKAQSGKILESTHEEQVWKSHLNYFDEVKPTDIDRELLLTIINGGEVELNPKNKKPYNQHVNTNNIFTSNDQISLKQRRVSIVKFGDRLNGRPLGNGTLKKIIEDIMDALPSFDWYYEIYSKVSKANEDHINPLAMETIITFFNKYFEFATPENSYTLSARKIFAPHEIYSCLKNTYNKQTITSERKEAILRALKHLEEKKLITPKAYTTTSTKYYVIYGIDFLKIQEEFNKINTKDEQNFKVMKKDLLTLFQPYFEKYIPDDDSEALGFKEYSEFEKNYVDRNEAFEAQQLRNEYRLPIKVPSHTVEEAMHSFFAFNKVIEQAFEGKEIDENSNLYQIACLINKSISKTLCESVKYESVLKEFKKRFINFNETAEKYLLGKYKKQLGWPDDEFLLLQSELKVSEIPHISEITGVRRPYTFPPHKPLSMIRGINQLKSEGKEDYKKIQEKKQKEKDEEITRQKKRREREIEEEKKWLENEGKEWQNASEEIRHKEFLKFQLEQIGDIPF